jgi:8-oxo-dGTP pyrophosphatase MutT (NUDIX family)
MTTQDPAEPPFRTVLEQRIRARRMTLEEFAEHVERFAREHNEPGTLSLRHLQRLVAGRRPDGRPVAPRLVTARILERIFGLTIEELLSPPDAPAPAAAHALRVAVAVVVRGDQVLVVRRKGEGRAQGLSWQFPAGMVKPGMDPQVAAVRETLRETDVHCVVRTSLGERLHPTTQVLCEYLLCDYLSGEARNVDAFENDEVAWVSPAELLRLIPSEQIYPPVLDALAVDSGNICA